MDPLEPTIAKFTLWRWLLLLSVITIALGGFVWWKSRSERLQFVEPIWSDSLAGHENDSAATGQRRKIGEVWSLTRSSGFAFRNQGLSLEFEGRYPVFTPTNPFLDAVSDHLLSEQRDQSAREMVSDWSAWWDIVKAPPAGYHWGVSSSFKVFFVSDRAISLRITKSTHQGGTHGNYRSRGRNFVAESGRLREVQLAELFHDTAWQSVISDFCLMDLQRQGTSFKGANVGEKPQGAFLTHIQNSFAITSDGLHCFFPNFLLDPFSNNEFEVFIPFEKLAEHLRPDGPHRQFQTKFGE